MEEVEKSTNLMFKFDPLSPNFLIDLINLGQKKGWFNIMLKYYHFNEKMYFNKLNIINANEFEDSGKIMARKLFEKMLNEIPAYSFFLKNNGIENKNLDKIHWNDLPIMNKDNYLRKYTKDQLIWNSNSNSIHTFSVSSGTSGKPYFWPRGAAQEVELSIALSNMLRYMKAGDEPTLVIITFSMGMYIAGLVVSDGISRIADKGMKLEMFTPGISFDDFFSIINNINGKYKKIIISGYPPLVKDFIVESINHGYNWEGKNVNFIFAAESFSEEWRDHIHDLVKTKIGLNTSLNIYGSADAGILGHETPFSNFIRKEASKNIDFAKKLFKDTRLPTLVQYYPNYKYFENINGELIFSSVGGYPLLRYNIKDSGDVIKYNKMIEICSEFGIDVEYEMQRLKQDFAKLPFLYLFGRKDFTASYYGLNVYPEHIKLGLEKSEEMRHLCTGKFRMEVRQDNEFDNLLFIDIELNMNILPNEVIKTKISNVIIDTLRIYNHEFNKLIEALGEKVKPRIELIKNGTEPSFKVEIKHKWKI